jgi:polyferredoxin
MEKVNLPKGLIRYASEENITKKAKFKFNTRMKAYTGVLSILVGILIGLLFIRSDIESRVLRLPGNLYETTENGELRNVYTYKLVNKTTFEKDSVYFKLLSHKGEIMRVGDNFTKVPPQDLDKGSLFINIHPMELDGHKTKVKIGVYSKGELIETTTANFMGPKTF